MSLKLPIWSILIVFSALIWSCSEHASSNKEYNHYQPVKQPLFHFYNIGEIEDAPVNYMDVWDRSTISALSINTIQFVVKGGKNPSDTLEKRVFKFSNKGKHMDYTDYKYDESPDIWSVGTLNWNQDQLNITFSRHFGIQRSSKTVIQPFNGHFLVLRQKKNGLADSTFIYGSLQQPTAMVSKIGKSIYSVQLFMNQSSSTSEIQAAFETIGLSANTLLNVNKSVVFLDKGLPVSAFQLDENCTQIGQIKSWEYSNKRQLLNYKEMVSNSTVREMEFSYRPDGLPSEMSINGKTYLYSYE